MSQMDTKKIKFIEILNTSLKEDTFIKLVLGSPNTEVLKLKVRLVLLKDKLKTSLAYVYKNKEITKNYEIEAGIREITKQLSRNFNTANLYTTEGDYHYQNKKIYESKPSMQKTQGLSHNKVKESLINLESEYLKKLNITGIENNVRNKKYDKYVQISNFIRHLDNVFSSNNMYSLNNLSIIDAGSGNGYISFAVYDFLNNIKGIKTTLTGFDIKAEIVEKTAKYAHDLNFSNLEFRNAQIMDVPNLPFDVLIALHACGNATDDAIYKGIINSAKIIMTAPCCHRLSKDLINLPKTYNRYGTIKYRQIELTTDLLRTLILEKYGYKSTIVEFTSLEHTDRNNLIIAVKENIPQSKVSNINQEIAEIKKYYGIKDTYLENLLENI